MQKGKELKPHIGIYGRRNYGKSSFINCITGQDIAIVSDIAGTTTELIHNSFKHSHASTIKIEIVQKENSLVILFQDDGIGFDYNKEITNEKLSTNKQGLFSITNRIKMFLGSIEFKQLEKGTL